MWSRRCQLVVVFMAETTETGLKKPLIPFPAALIRTMCVDGLSLAPVDADRGPLFLSLIKIYISFRFRLLLGVILKLVRVFQQVFIIFYFSMIYCVSFASTLKMRSQTGNVRSLSPTGATGMILLFYKSPSKRLSTLHSNDVASCYFGERCRDSFCFGSLKCCKTLSGPLAHCKRGCCAKMEQTCWNSKCAGRSWGQTASVYV